MWWWLLAACAPDGRAPVTVPVTFAAIPSADVGDVHLDVLSLTIADLRFESPADAHARASWLPALIPVAHAHPGHDPSGAVDGELLGQWTVDLLGDDTFLGDAQAWEGELATGRLALVGAMLEGTVGATPFRFEITEPDDVTGIPAEATLRADAPAAMTLRFDPEVALSFVTFGDAGPDGAYDLADGDLGNTVPFGLVSTAAWIFDLE